MRSSLRRLTFSTSKFLHPDRYISTSSKIKGGINELIFERLLSSMQNMRKYPKLEGVIFIFSPHRAFFSFSYDVLFTGKTFSAIFIG